MRWEVVLQTASTPLEGHSGLGGAEMLLLSLPYRSGAAVEASDEVQAKGGH